MSTVPKFLNEVNDRIQAISTQLDEVNNLKNKMLEIENILFEYGIDKNSLSIEDLLKLSKDAFKKVMELIKVPDIDMEAAFFVEHKKVIDLYKSLANNYGDIEGANQYNDANKWLSNKLVTIVNWINSFSNDKTDELKESLEYFNQITTYFKGNELVTPILDTDELNRVLAVCGFPLSEIAMIKKEIGIKTLELLIPPEVKKEIIDPLDKYREIIEEKKDIYAEVIPSVLNLVEKSDIILNFEKLEDQILEIASLNEDITYKNIQNIIVLVFLKAEINEYEEEINKNISEETKEKLLDETIKQCEELLIISNKNEPRKKEEVKESKKTVDVKTEADILVEQANSIFDVENTFLMEINIDDHQRYLELLAKIDDVNLPEIEQNNNRLALIVETLRKEISVFKDIISKHKESPSQHASEYKTKMRTIREYISVYEMLKSKIEDKDNAPRANTYKLLYLSNPEGKAVMIQYINTLSEAFRKQISSILSDITSGKLANKESTIMVEDYIVYTSERKNVMLSYIMISEKVLLILFAAEKRKDADEILDKIVSSYKRSIDALIKRGQDSLELPILLDEQANLRAELSNYFSNHVPSRSKAA